MQGSNLFFDPKIECLSTQGTLKRGWKGVLSNKLKGKVGIIECISHDILQVLPFGQLTVY